MAFDYVEHVEHVENAKLEKFTAAPKIIECETLSRLELLSVMIKAMGAQARHNAKIIACV